jgi:hypothetical protein
MSSHSPLPWKVTDVPPHGGVFDRFTYAVLDANGRTVMHDGGIDYEGGEEPMSVENAKFVVSELNRAHGASDSSGATQDDVVREFRENVERLLTSRYVLEEEAAELRRKEAALKAENERLRAVLKDAYECALSALGIHIDDYDLEDHITRCKAARNPHTRNLARVASMSRTALAARAALEGGAT